MREGEGGREREGEGGEREGWSYARSERTLKTFLQHRLILRPVAIDKNVQPPRAAMVRESSLAF